ncbi:WD repeat-containing protein 74 [Apophysomyces ossiformis]|uniref:Ribosome biogenesis protein NSA1 n=1 Tax=Apophysomyces ossiformis TaxID=679940 RepID=A0A8H7EM44_9FUNG|nr:WD repeat-containing protein 74 [Apophysomyces ossiformis]
MKYFTGDENGLVKWVVFPPPKAEKLKKRAKRDEEKEADGKEGSKKEEPTFMTGNFGKVNPNEYVQKMAWGMLDGKKQLVIARKSGKIQYMAPETGEIVREYKDTNVSTTDGKLGFVGLYATNSHVAACSSAGHFSYTSLSTPSGTTTSVATLDSDLSIMRFHPTQSHVFATGGKENDLCIYDLNALSNTESSNETNDATNQSKQSKKQAKGILFKAKNVKNDFLDLQQPVWVRDVQFMSEDANKVVVGTHYHQIRLYDAKAARRPVLNVEIGKHPVTNVRIGKDYNQILFTDTVSDVSAVDIRTGKLVARYKGFQGAARDVIVTPEPTFSSSSEKAPMLVSVSIDRFLRVHEMTSTYRRLEHKAYLKQRLTCVLVDEEFELPKSEEEQKEEEEEEALWASMEKVNAKRKRTV